MSAIENHPVLSRDRPSAVFHAMRPSRARPIAAVMLLVVMGLLAAASVLASRPYRPAEHSWASTSPAQHSASGQRPDTC